MESKYRIKLTLKENYYSGIYDFIKILMNKKFMPPSLPTESDLIIKGYQLNQDVYLQYTQKTSVYHSNEEVINDLFLVLKIHTYEFKFDDVEHGFFDEFTYSCSLLENTENGIAKTLSYLERALVEITDEEKSLKAFSKFEMARNIFLLSNSNLNDIYSYLFAFSDFCNNLEYMSMARSYFRYKFNRIHLDNYSAQEHFKKIVHPIHIKLKSLGFRKKGFKFIQLDKENELERVIWLQKSRFSFKDELLFTINFCVRPIGLNTNYERLGPQHKLKSNGWFVVNISIDTEKTIKELELHIDKILELVLKYDKRQGILEK